MHFLATWMLLFYLFCAHSIAAQVIVNDSAVDHRLSLQELRLIFSMQKTYWPDGNKIHVFILTPSSDLHKEFCVQQLDMMPYMLQKRWDRLVFSGTGERPEILRSEAEMKQLILQTPGAIGYISNTGSLARGLYE
ncbi:hypothetical protein HQQ94_18280 [Shewanella sp. VB17]|uniref:hypothetical protein n=1 Tax=Shewanella sp. VB17 TaxID=2739432 RepID=UPI0015675FBA|nr:hypothetical protein [Shewanella sp. VB17]NRD75130.1 hypothetical protein [Shewanella sp. VB17]